MNILAIETSCDETSVAMLKAKGGLKNPSFDVLSNIVLSQVKLHAEWGGVVPNLAKREHQANLIPVLKKALEKSGFYNEKQKMKNEKLQPEILNSVLEREPELLEQFLKFIPTIKPPRIDAIAVTIGPGLEPALWVGINFAKALSLVWNKPMVAVNHMEGHIVASLLKEKMKMKNEKVGFPAIALLVSGGHTELALIKNWGDYKIIGETRDDAVGECFDKCARMLGLPYPGGPQIARQAENYKKYPLTFRMGGWTRREMEKEAFNLKLPRPMIDSKDYDFSFSGLKTAVLYMLKDMKERHVNIGDFTPMICNEIQQSAVDVLVLKTIKAAKEFGAKSIILGGGVAANKELRAQIKKAVAREFAKTTALYLPSTKLTTDNAAMIGAAGYLHATNGDFAKPEKMAAKGNLLL
ncbi:TPA: tRNA (adenosine(37)-N6)-threonylcarbamoyltransferase complex transferase subunit TsaD [Patescibacteria group bacterium]|nr:MAG: putative tRNA threonylcarbamoyladenosine biosynthesis protein Gcp [Parcubacteria group bacterium GW2011_GWF2_40_10]KKR47202.1 MAG: putative tRNA threonylcarbamoyladenosine biosynthesis protein Gcp [Parcubacteria group bacterium GW2011_GWA2_40_143]KKR60167.1 MAG: putative tRNA threonylcarbamoyladenosine biosynthesis protein Gcp [Parcubacteria group bacterium GW2011_GWC2_40_31]KKR74835.1 MAG: putative tRNA threonylcarbamoyladenosine biosynthesis protein Gcp [Parcubacteria group bacterium G